MKNSEVGVRQAEDGKKAKDGRKLVPSALNGIERSEAIATGITAMIETITASMRYAQNLGNSGAGVKPPVSLAPGTEEVPIALKEGEVGIGAAETG